MPIRLFIDKRESGKLRRPAEVIEKYFASRNSIYARMVQEAFGEFQESILQFLREYTPHNTEHEYRKSQETVRAASPKSTFQSVIDQDGPDDGELKGGWKAEVEAAKVTSRDIAVRIFNEVARDDEQAALVLRLIESGYDSHTYSPSEENKSRTMKIQTREMAKGEYRLHHGTATRPGRPAVKEIQEMLNGTISYENELKAFEDRLYEISNAIKNQLGSKGKVSRPKRTL